MMSDLGSLFVCPGLSVIQTGVELYLVLHADSKGFWQ